MNYIIQQNTSSFFAFVLDLLWQFLALMFSYLPDSTGLPANAVAALSQIFSWLKSWSVVVPWDAPLLGIRGLLISTAFVWGAVGAFMLVNMVLNRFWGHH